MSAETDSGSAAEAPAMGAAAAPAADLAAMGSSPEEAIATLDAWTGRLRDGPVARDTRAWNVIHGAVESIRAALAAVKE